MRCLPALLISTLVAALAHPLLADDKLDAKPIFEQRCAFCHGTDGKGTGPAGMALQPPPPDFTTADFWRTRGSDQIRQVITAGKPGTSMVGFGSTLKKEEIAALVELVEKFKPAGQ